MSPCIKPTNRSSKKVGQWGSDRRDDKKPAGGYGMLILCLAPSDSVLLKQGDRDITSPGSLIVVWAPNQALEFHTELGLVPSPKITSMSDSRRRVHYFSDSRPSQHFLAPLVNVRPVLDMHSQERKHPWHGKRKI